MRHHAEESRNIDGAARELFLVKNHLQMLLNRYRE
jgi:hypothetical protein